MWKKYVKRNFDTKTVEDRNMTDKLIYVVDDEKSIRDLIKAYLVKEGYTVKTFQSGESALAAFNNTKCHLMVIDIMMTGMDGYELCREIRKSSDIPIIMVSAKDDEIDRILGLELGSDDYLSKPFSPRELVVRIKNIFRRIDKSNDNNMDEKEINKMLINDLIILEDERKAVANGNELKLTNKEFEFLLFMVKNKNRAFSREQILDNIWGYDYYGEERAVDDLVKRIRKKLRETNSKVEILTVWGYGYKIVDQGES